MSSYTRARHQKIDGGLYRVISKSPDGMWFYVGGTNSPIGVMVPNGFITDGPSMPDWVKRVLVWLGMLEWVTESLLKASAVHDRMREDTQFSILEADCYFLIAMKADQKNWDGDPIFKFILREGAFLAVRTNKARSTRNK